MPMPKRGDSLRKLNRGVTFGEDVLEYLDVLMESQGCSRSFLVNTIIRGHAIATGHAEPVREEKSVASPVIRL